MFFSSADSIREIFGTTPHLKADKDEIRAFFEATADQDARTSYIQSIFNNDYTEVILKDGRRCGYKTYQNGLLLWEGSYLSRTKQCFYEWRIIAKYFDAMRISLKANALGFIDAQKLNAELDRLHKFQADVERQFLRPGESNLKWQ